MKKFYTILIALMALSLTGCLDSYKGELDVKQNFTLKANKKGDANMYLYKGLYNVKLKTKKSGDKRQAILEVHTGGRKPQEAYFKIGEFIPNEGHFRLSSNTTGQPVDLDGYSQHSVTRSEVIRDREPCKIAYRRWVCDPRRGRDDRERCYWETYYDHGFQDVEYHYVYTRDQLDIDLIKLNSNITLAELSVADEVTQKVIDYRGRCF